MGRTMRFIIALMILLVSAPMLAHERLDAADVQRFIDVAGKVMAQAPAPGGGGAPIPARDILGHPPASLAPLLAQEGFSRASWQRLARRVLMAQQMTHILAAVAQADEDERTASARKLAPGSGLTGFDRLEMATLVRWTQNDRAALERETRDDRAVVAPFMQRLDALDQRVVR